MTCFKLNAFCIPLFIYYTYSFEAHLHEFAKHKRQTFVSFTFSKCYEGSRCKDPSADKKPKNVQQEASFNEHKAVKTKENQK